MADFMREVRNTSCMSSTPETDWWWSWATPGGIERKADQHGHFMELPDPTHWQEEGKDCESG